MLSVVSKRLASSLVIDSIRLACTLLAVGILGVSCGQESVPTSLGSPDTDESTTTVPIADLVSLGFRRLDRVGCPGAQDLEQLLSWVRAGTRDRDLIDKCAANIVASAHVTGAMETDVSTYLRSATVSAALMNEFASTADNHSSSAPAARSPDITGTLAGGPIRVLIIRAAQPIFVPGQSADGSESIQADTILFLYAANLDHSDTSLYILDSSTSFYSSLTGYLDQ